MCTRALDCRRPATDLELRLDPASTAPAQAREFVRHHLPKLGLPNLVDDATLIAAELVTNSVKYAPDGPIWLSLRLASGRLLIEVQDCSPELPVFRDPDYVAESGRGLHIVKAYAAILRWIPVPGGKVTWALLEGDSVSRRRDINSAVT
jgi:anti-sigma regulatory factor (Ser/Thr protein kinase)